MQLANQCQQEVLNKLYGHPVPLGKVALLKGPFIAGKKEKVVKYRNELNVPRPQHSFMGVADRAIRLSNLLRASHPILFPYLTRTSRFETKATKDHLRTSGSQGRKLRLCFVYKF